MAVRCGHPSAGARVFRGFTLIELLAVIAIIGVLASVVLGFGRHAIISGKQTRAKAEMAMVASALEAYRRQHGDYPRTADAAQLLQSLIGRRGPLNETADGRALLDTAAFSTAGGRDPRTDETAQLADPWGQPYFYAYRTVAPWTNFSFLLASAGPDGAVHPALLPGGFIDSAHPANADNVTVNR